MPFALGRVVFQSPLTTRKPGDIFEVREKESEIIATLKKTVESQRQTIVKLENHMEDVSQQNITLRRSITITPEEKETMKLQAQHTIGLQQQLNRLAVWMRINKADEISRGEHNGVDLISLVLKYLGGIIPKDDVPAIVTAPPEVGKAN